MSVLKAHYFLWFGSLSGILPYVSIFAKEHSVASATEVGLLYTALPFAAFLAKPMFCSLADHYHLHKVTLLVFMGLTLTGYGLLLLIPFAKQVWGHYSWWYFCLSLFLANSSMGVVISLTDSLVMREVTRTQSTYGSTRVWGTIGWGIFGLLAGIINDKSLIDMKSLGVPYLVPGLLMFILLMVVDIMAVGLKLDSGQSLEQESGSLDQREEERMEMVPQLMRNSVWKEVAVTFANFPSLYRFTAIIIVIGMLTAFHWSFFFWYIESINGPDTLLMGLTLVVQCFFGELPFFLISEKVVDKVGPSMALNVSLVAFGVRYLAYGYLIKEGSAYYVLFVELTQGPTFGLFYCVMTALAQEYALKSGSGTLQRTDDQPPRVDPKRNTFATMQAIFGACYEGAGLGIGAFVAGLAIDNLGIIWTWRMAAFFSLSIFAVNLLVDLITFFR